VGLGCGQARIQDVVVECRVVGLGAVVGYKTQVGVGKLPAGRRGEGVIGWMRRGGHGGGFVEGRIGVTVVQAAVERTAVAAAAAVVAGDTDKVVGGAGKTAVGTAAGTAEDMIVVVGN
jgi:hypothetical protein